MTVFYQIKSTYITYFYSITKRERESLIYCFGKLICLIVGKRYYIGSIVISFGTKPNLHVSDRSHVMAIQSSDWSATKRGIKLFALVITWPNLKE